MLDRTVAPQAYPIAGISFPVYHVHPFAQGMEGVLVFDHAHPVVSVEILLKSGRWYENVPGVSYYAIKMLQEGTATKSAEQVAFGFESLGSFLELNTGLDHCVVKLYSLKRTFEKSLALLQEILFSPVFPEKEFGLMRVQRSEQIKAHLSNNSQLATLLFNKKLFGENHPYGTILTPDRVMELELGQVTDYYRHQLFYEPQLLLTGHVEEKEIELVNNMLCIPMTLSGGQMGSTGHARKEAEPVMASRQSTQASVRLGSRTIGKNHPDFHNLSISNSLLGGFFGSRLMKNIREEKGYTYGIYSSLIQTLHENYWLVSTEMTKDNVKLGIEEIKKEIALLAAVAPTNEEMDILKNYLKGKLMGSMDTVFGKAQLVKSLAIHKLPENYFDTYFESIERLTPDQIPALIDTYLQADPQVLIELS
ncbi:MAG: insulinase family protein [Cyclobacteriaceae bacterium]|nr:insulinase family protein [Cyclobacteriaceae bacterium]